MYQCVVTSDHFVKELHTVLVHKIQVNGTEDPDLFVAEPIYQWQQTDAGKFVMENATKDSVRWERQISLDWYGHTYAIVAELESKKLSEFYLRYGKLNGNY
jgi:hypothetical protein